MSSTVVFSSPSGKVALVGGLDWRLLPATANAGKVERHVRDGAADMAARYVARAHAFGPEELRERGKSTLVRRIKAGYFQQSDTASFPKGAHSLAAAFAHWTAEHQKALLNVRFGEDAWAVVVVINGLPVLDKIEKTSLGAFEIARSYLADGDEISVFSDDEEKFPGALDHADLLEKISLGVTRQTAIKAIPLDYVRLIVIAALLLGALGGFWYWKHLQAQQARREAIAQQQAGDPIPKYIGALAAAREDVGMDVASIKDSIAFAMQLPLTPTGWNATHIGCATKVGCEVVFARTTGTFAGLMKAAPLLTLTPAATLNLNEARMTWPQNMTVARLDPATPLPGMADFVQGVEASKLQDWLVAGLTIQLAPPQLWPKAPGVPDSFKHPAALASGRFDIEGIALPQLLEAMAKAPANATWTGWSVDVGERKQEPLSRASARLLGNYYVTNH